MRLSAAALAAARALVAERLGLHFPEHRHDDLERRILGAWRASGGDDPGRYLARLEKIASDAPEWIQLVAKLTVGETYFFRDRGSFEALEQHVLPPLIERRRRERARWLRLWSAGCSTGEEPYSLAMLVDGLLPDRTDWTVTILATDVNPRSLATARAGRYREWSLRDTSESIRRRYFSQRGPGTYELDAVIRGMVTFARLNLADDAGPSPAIGTSAMDVILCRNVLMYLTPDVQRAVVARLHGALANGGWLAVSAAEASTELLRPLEPVSFPDALFYRKSAVPPLRPWAPAAPPPLPAARRERAPRSVAERPRRPDRPPEPAEPLESARTEADRGRLDRAATLCRQAIAHDRLDPDAHLLLAAIEHERGNVRAALEAVRAAIYLVPDSPSAHFMLANLLLREGDPAGARRSMQAVATLLASVPADEVVDHAGGLSAGQLREAAAAQMGVR